MWAPPAKEKKTQSMRRRRRPTLSTPCMKGTTGSVLACVVWVGFALQGSLKATAVGWTQIQRAGGSPEGRLMSSRKLSVSYEWIAEAVSSVAGGLFSSVSYRGAQLIIATASVLFLQFGLLLRERETPIGAKLSLLVFNLRPGRRECVARGHCTRRKKTDERHGYGLSSNSRSIFTTIIRNGCWYYRTQCLVNTTLSSPAFDAGAWR